MAFQSSLSILELFDHLILEELLKTAGIDFLFLKLFLPFTPYRLGESDFNSEVSCSYSIHIPLFVVELSRKSQIVDRITKNKRTSNTNKC